MSLITVEALAYQLTAGTPDGSHLVVCDVRWYLGDHAQGRVEYDAGHIPGARFVDLHHDLADVEAGGGRHPLPTVESFASLLGRLGIDQTTSVVVYDAAGGATASRLWWMLRSIGHGRVAVLDGGFAAWTSGEHQVESVEPIVASTTYPTPPEWTGIVDADAVAQSIEFGGVVIDSRAADRFRGDVEPLDARAGHVPGAINRFHGEVVGTDGQFRPTNELVEHFAGAGQNPIVYCGSGVTACHNLLALSLIGVHGGRLYPGSWSEWSADDSRPAATGSTDT